MTITNSHQPVATEQVATIMVPIHKSFISEEELEAALERNTVGASSWSFTDYGLINGVYLEDSYLITYKFAPEDILPVLSKLANGYVNELIAGS
jgi:hypothetical protein